MKFVALIVVLAISLYPMQKAMDAKWGSREELVEELMYFPTGSFLKKLVMGYDEVVADIVWLRMIQYYGEHHKSDKRFDYLGHILDVLTDLDPRFIHGYTFGALLLTDDAKDPARGLAILDKGTRHNPLDWRLPFMSGFIHYVFLGDLKAAGAFFEKASLLPGAPDFTARFAAFTYGRRGETDLSLDLWYSLYHATDNDYEKRSALRYIKRIESDRLSRLVADYRDLHGSYPTDLGELVRIGWLKGIPRPPDGSSYVLDTATGEVVSVE